MLNIMKFEFAYEGRVYPVRQIEMPDGRLAWIAKDLCDVLDLGNVSEALSGLDDDEKSNISNPDVALGGRPWLVVYEPGLYGLILRSRKPQTKTFKRWVTHEVLPQIREKGFYCRSDGSLTLPDPLVAQAETTLALTREFVRLRDEQAAIRRAQEEAKLTQHALQVSVVALEAAEATRKDQEAQAIESLRQLPTPAVDA